MIQIKCGGCALNSEAPDELAGKQGKCPHCGAVCDIPDVSGEERADTPGKKAGEKRRAPALVPCPACGKQISDFAEFCPGCGDKSSSPGAGERVGRGDLIPYLEHIIEELKKMHGEY